MSRVGDRGVKVNRKGDKDDIKPYDVCETPHYALDPLLKYVPKDWVVWESAAGSGRMVAKLTHENYTVLGSDLVNNVNFFDFELPNYDIQITNPPFSIKYKWFERSYELGKPFAILTRIDALGAQTAQRLFKRHGMQLIVLDKRINYYMPYKGYDGGGAHFASAWFTWQLNLPADIVYERINRYEDYAWKNPLETVFVD